MAALVVASEVEAITGIDATSPVMAPSIAAADLIVTEDLVDSGFSDNRKKQIELFLASHFAKLASTEGPLAGETIGQASERYHNIYKAGLSSTQYGQQAMLLDTTGTLAKMADSVENPAKKSARFTVIGSPDVTPYIYGDEWPYS